MYQGILTERERNHWLRSRLESSVHEHINESQHIAESTLMAIMGRESAYSGKKVDWDWAMEKSQQKLGPDDPSFETAPPMMDVPVPGEYKLV